MATFCDIDNCNQLSFRTDRLTRRHYCRSHYQFHSTDLDKRSITAKALSKGKIVKPTKELRFQPVKKIRPGTFDESVLSNGSVGELIITPDLMGDFWFKAECVIRNKPYCWECNDFIHKDYYRAATAHIFPKSIFESVASNEWNYLVLGAACGCHNLSHRLDTFSQMKVFGTAINRFHKFKHLITERHKYLDLFREYAKYH